LICLDVVLIESLDSRDFLDTLKKDILTVEKFLTVWKMTSWLSRNSWLFEKWHLVKSWQSLCYKVSICLNFYLCLDRDSRSWHFEKGHLDCRESLDTLKKDILTVEKVSTLWKRTSRQSRPPGLLLLHFQQINSAVLFFPFLIVHSKSNRIFWCYEAIDYCHREIKCICVRLRSTSWIYI
jgi:hypothetical protein